MLPGEIGLLFGGLYDSADGLILLLQGYDAHLEDLLGRFVIRSFGGGSDQPDQPCQFCVDAPTYCAAGNSNHLLLS